MSKPEETENPAIEARWKEFWEDHKDYDPSWVGEFLGELHEDLRYVFGEPATGEGLDLMYRRCGVDPERVLTARELLKLPIGKFALSARAYAYYGLWTDWLDEMNIDSLGGYLSLFTGGFFSCSHALAHESGKENEDYQTLVAAHARAKLDRDDPDEGVAPEDLAALARVSRKSIMNLLAPKGGGVLQSNSENLITVESARRWLLARDDFRPSILPAGHFPLPTAELSSIDKPLFVPVASDGSWFSPADQRDGQYYVANRDDEQRFPDYEDALDFLTRASSPRWRYSDAIGRWRTRAATGWERKARHEVIKATKKTKRKGKAA